MLSRFAPLLLAALCVSTVASAGCAALRQNMRGQELSYRGAWFCEADGCSEKDMVQSRVGSRDGTTTINEVQLRPSAALAFTAEAAFDALEASVTDCKGKSVAVPTGDIAKAGSHSVGDDSARESWIVWVDPAHLDGLKLGNKGSCAIWKVEARATWSDGSTYSLLSGIQVEG